MYIDKIYTKLYSNKDWNGLNNLVNEIRSFGAQLQRVKKLMDPEEAENLQKRRDNYVRYLKSSDDWKKRNSLWNRLTGKSDKLRDEMLEGVSRYNEGTVRDALFKYLYDDRKKKGGNYPIDMNNYKVR